jgi:hypothetical protein
MNNDDITLLARFKSASSFGHDYADLFFQRMQFIQLIVQGHYNDGYNLGLRTLSTLDGLDSECYHKIHKGTPFYWMGVAASLLHIYDSATYFFDAAVSEDLRAGADPIKSPSPALFFIQVVGEPKAQAAKPLVMLLQDKIQKLLIDYNMTVAIPSNTKHLDLTCLRESYLTPAITHPKWRSLASSFLSYILEWQYKIQLLAVRKESGTFEPFLLYLFKGCLLFESLLKENPKCQVDKSTLSCVLCFLSNNHLLPKIGSITARTFSEVLSSPLINHSRPPIDRIIQITGKLRNTTGHTLGWDFSMDTKQYEKLVSYVMYSCLYAIANLYTK